MDLNRSLAEPETRERFQQSPIRHTCQHRLFRAAAPVLDDMVRYHGQVSIYEWALQHVRSSDNRDGRANMHASKLHALAERRAGIPTGLGQGAGERGWGGSGGEPRRLCSAWVIQLGM